VAGRWLSSDVLGLAGGRDVFGWNGSPTEIIDPLGLIALAERGYSVYGLYECEETTPYYIGITNDTRRREAEHQESGRLVPHSHMRVLPGSDSIRYAEARGHEQAYMEHFGTKPKSTRGNYPNNIINSFRHDRSDQRGKRFEQEYLRKKRQLDEQVNACSKAKR
jgi:hypothetical protein